MGTSGCAMVRALALLVASAVMVSWGALVSPVDAHVYPSYVRQRRHIVHRAKKQLGGRYLYGGTSPKRGFDCSGFTRWVFKDHGADLPHSSLKQFRLGRKGSHKRLWSRKSLRRGDLVFFKPTTARVGHVGIYIGDGDFISATSSGGVAVQSVRDPYYWGERWVGGTRLDVTRAR